MPRNSSVPVAAAPAAALGSGPTPAQLLSKLDGQAVTQGWDVVHAMSAGKANGLFQSQFVLDLVEQSNLPPISGSVPVVANLSVQLVDVILGSPLIAFDPQLEPGTANLEVPIVSGLAHLVATTGSEVTVLSSQWIEESGGYVLTGLVPLAALPGKVEQCDVVLQVADGRGFASDLALPGAAGTLIGQFMLTFLQQHATGYRYSLGTVNMAPNGTELTPKTFEIATQVDANDPTDAGRVLLFIATTYNPNGGSQPVLQLANVVPAGYDTTLFVASRTLFGDIIAAALDPLFAAVVPSQLQGGASYVHCVGGWAYTGPVSTSDGSTDSYGSGTCDLDSGANIPLDGIQLAPADGSIVATWPGGGVWEQDWYHLNTAKDGSCVCGKISMTASLNTSYIASVNPQTSVVSFVADNTLTVGFDHSSTWSKIFGDGAATDKLGSVLESAAATALAPALSLTLPSVGTFAVSSLLFGEQVCQFSEANVPGDLVLFGQLAASGLSISPALGWVTAGDQIAFAANEPVDWSASWGQIDANGTYTPPARVSRSTVVVITATLTSDQSTQAYAGVIVVPAQVVVSPIVAITQPLYGQQQFEAALAGSTGAPAWAISPQVGSIDPATGIYTPPDSIDEPTVVTVTATIGTATGVATVVVLPQLPSGVAVDPYATTPLSPGATQQLTATAAGQPVEVDWSLLPEVGAINGGLYSAPEQLTAPQAVVAMATSKADPTATGAAVILLSPVSDWLGDGVIPPAPAGAARR